MTRQRSGLANSALEAVPLAADDLPGYAGRLFDYLVDHPERHRLALWRTLEGSPPTEAEIQGTGSRAMMLAWTRHRIP